ncbi:MFS transporter, partial [Nocardiopsis tropica]|nr:MFS transporter [Nocardiopsis tropica]
MTTAVGPSPGAAHAGGTGALPRSVHAWYGSGAVATGIFNTVPGLLLLIYLTDTLAVGPALAGLVVLLPKLVDLLVSPYIGIRSDRTRSSWGPRRPWMLAGVWTSGEAMAQAVGTGLLSLSLALSGYVES